jgi:HEAT repeat protein
MNLALPATLLVLIASAAPLAAHGGMYRGPFDPRPPAGPGGPGPTTPGGPTLPGPFTGGEVDLTRWEFWWEFNKEPYLRLKDAVHAGGPVSGSDDFYFGPSRRGEAAASLAPTAADRRSRVVPALHAALAAGDSRDLLTACLIALGKIGLDVPEAPLIDRLCWYLASREQEVRETAALALGISARPEALGTLIALHRSTPEGCRLAARSEAVEDRMRAFAGYGLGLLALRNADLRIKTEVFAALDATLLDPLEKSRDVKIAALHGIRLLDLRAGGPAGERRLLWRALAALERELDREVTRTWQVVQAHVPPAIARLLGRGQSVDHLRMKRRFAKLLDPGLRQNHALAQSAALALGVLCEPPERVADEAPFVQALRQYHADGKDVQARMFCLIALGQIGGAGAIELLARALDKGNDTERCWAALALGLAARGAGEAAQGNLRRDAAQAILRSLSRAKTPDLIGSHAIGLGLSGWVEAAPRLRALLDEHEKQDDVAGHLCIALALLRDPDATEPIRQVVARALRRPDLMRNSAGALALIGDKSAIDLLIGLLRGGDLNTARLSAFARALGWIGDRRTLDPLLELLPDTRLTMLSRAYVAAGLGAVCDPEPLPWHSHISVDANYRAEVETLTDRRAGVLDIL